MALPRLAILDSIINQGQFDPTAVAVMRLILGNQLEGQVVAMLRRIVEEEVRVHIVFINNLNNGGEVEEQFEEEGEFIQDAPADPQAAAEVNPFVQGEDALPGGFRMRPGQDDESQERNRRCFRYSNHISETETDSDAGEEELRSLASNFVLGQSRKRGREEEDDDEDEMGGKKAKRS